MKYVVRFKEDSEARNKIICGNVALQVKNNLLLWDGQTYTGTDIKILWPKPIWSFYATFSNIFSSIISAWTSMWTPIHLLLQLSQILVFDFCLILYIM
jgi:hypothetical protein